MRNVSLLLTALAMAANATADSGPDSVLEAAVADGRVPGVVAMVADSTGVIYAKAAGFADVAGQTPMQIDSMFRIASMTKPITSVAMMQLIEQGKVELDAPISDYLDDFEARKVLLSVADGVPTYSDEAHTPTIRQLLSHSPGFGYSVWNERLFAITDFAGFSPTYFMSEPLVFEPGSQWHYGTGTDWAGLIIERITGNSLEAYFHDAITAPLGMVDTSYNLADAKQARVVTRHQRGADGELTELPNDDFSEVTFYSGGGGLRSTAADYVRFMQMMLGHGDDNVRILSAASLAAMGENQIGDIAVGEMKTRMPNFSNDFDVYPNTVARFGLGFLINEKDIPGRRRSGSLTWAGLYNSYFWIDRKSGICGVLMTQILPFYDPAVVDLLAEFETAIYESIRMN